MSAGLPERRSVRRHPTLGVVCTLGVHPSEGDRLADDLAELDDDLGEDALFAYFVGHAPQPCGGAVYERDDDGDRLVYDASREADRELERWSDDGIMREARIAPAGELRRE